MRLHLVIQRHGLPVTRILWTTSSSQSSASHVHPATSSVITSTRTPNAAFSNGGYTIAQLLEDVNEVIPLETEPTLVNDESSGQWGLEDYVVEVAGSECLHFMDVDGLLRDGDEVVIRALQTSDLRARRLSGRHQISTDGKHLIDGVPFGRPFLKRTSSSRPAIAIPPRKRRRTLFDGWATTGAAYEEEDTEWAPQPLPHRIFGTEVPALEEEDDHEGETQDGTVIRYNIPDTEDVQESESDADVSDFEDEDLADELEALKEDMEKDLEPSGIIPESDAGHQDERRSGDGLRSGSPRQTGLRDDHVVKSPSSTFFSANETSPGAESSRRASKIVRFEQPSEGDMHLLSMLEESLPGKDVTNAEIISEETSALSDRKMASESASSESDSSEASSEEEDSTSDSEVESDSDDDSTSDSEDSTSDSENSTSDSEDESTSESEEDSVSESEDEKVSAAALKPKVNPPGQGSERTKKSNRRSKMRRRLSKLKELGALPAEADFAALRAWEEVNGSWYPPPETSVEAKVPPKEVSDKKSQLQEQERLEFEARRLKLLRDLASGGIDIDESPGKENVPPDQNKDDIQEPTKEDKVPTEDTQLPSANEEATEPSKRRALDVASSRRLLFGSLGVRNPRSKAEEEATRKKLAGKTKQYRPQRASVSGPTEEVESDSEVNWQDKLVIKATECIFDDIELSAPPFPFEQRWDAEAHETIGQRKGWGKKRKRRQRASQVYQEYQEEEDEGDYEYGVDSYFEGDAQLNYDDTEQPNGEVSEKEVQVDQKAEEPTEDVSDDLPALPGDLSLIPYLVEKEVKKGSVIAFKELEVSKANSWQPRLSDYKVAAVHGVGDGIIKLRLTKQYRDQRKEVADDEEGPRQYSGFEMPGYDDNETEDDGFREVPFVELYEPKLLRAAAHTDPAGPETAPEASIPSAKDEPVQNRSAAADDDAATHISETLPNAPLEMSVGFDRQIPSDGGPIDDFLDSIGPNVTRTRGGEEDERSMSSAIKSPAFEGFPRRSHSMAPTPKNKKQKRDSTPVSIEVSIACQDEGDEFSVGFDSVLPEMDSPSPLRSPSGLFDDASKSPDRSTTPVDRKPKRSNVGSLEPSKREGHRSTSPSSEAGLTVRNPFFVKDREYEERRLSQSEELLLDSSIFEGQHPSIEGSPSGTDHWDPTSGRKEPSPPVSSFPAPVNPEDAIKRSKSDSFQPSQPIQRNSTQPNASQMSEIVDLTQSSPLVSPGGSDKDYAKPHRMPRGPGWVQKNPTSRRTRSSTGGRVQALKDVSISPPKLKKRRR